MEETLKTTKLPNWFIGAVSKVVFIPMAIQPFGKKQRPSFQNMKNA